MHDVRNVGQVAHVTFAMKAWSDLITFVFFPRIQDSLHKPAVGQELLKKGWKSTKKINLYNTYID